VYTNYTCVDQLHLFVCTWRAHGVIEQKREGWVVVGV